MLLLCVSHLSERTQAGAIKTLAENRAEKQNYRRKMIFFKPCLFIYFFIANDTGAEIRIQSPLLQSTIGQC